MAINSDIQGLIVAAAKRYGVDPDLFAKLVEAESAGNPLAVSPKGAQGLAQLMPETGKYLAGSSNYQPFDAAQNLDLGAKYLSQLKKQFGSDEAALAAYNAGPGAVSKALKDGSLSPDELPQETRGYLKKILGDKVKEQAVNKAGSSLKDMLGFGESGAVANQTFGGLQASEPVASSMGGGEILADGSVVGEGPFALSGIGGAGNAILPGLGVIGGIDLYKTQPGGARGVVQGAASGAAMGSYFGPPGAIVGAVLGGTLGLASKTGKDKDQISRDGVRSALQNIGVLDKDYNVKLADGSLYNMGVDGHFSLPNTDGTARHSYDVDFSNPLAHQAVGWANPLALILSNGDKKITSDTAGQFVNAALSNAKSLEDARGNMVTIFSRMGLDGDKAASIIKSLKDQGRITENEMNAAIYGLGTLSSGKYNPNEREIFQGQQNNTASLQGNTTHQAPVPPVPNTTPPARNTGPAPMTESQRQALTQPRRAF